MKFNWQLVLVAQRSVLGPILLNDLINNLKNVIEIVLSKFTGDTKLGVSS